MYSRIPISYNHPTPQWNLLMKYLEIIGAETMENKLPVKSTVLYGEGEDGRWAKADKRRTSVPTLKDLVAPQIIPVFTICCELQTSGKRPCRKNTG
jgi:hypothetical protein